MLTLLNCQKLRRFLIDCKYNWTCYLNYPAEVLGITYINEDPFQDNNFILQVMKFLNVSVYKVINLKVIELLNNCLFEPLLLEETMILLRQWAKAILSDF